MFYVYILFLFFFFQIHLNVTDSLKRVCSSKDRNSTEMEKSAKPNTKKTYSNEQ